MGGGIIGLILRSMKENRDRWAATDKAITQLQVQISPFWAGIQVKLADSLHHPGAGHEELDALLEKLLALTLAPADTRRLTERLTVIKDRGPTDEAEKADTLLRVMPMVLREAAGALPVTDQRSMQAKDALKP